jgi:threonine/homoserine/homoserine lactone efflux protein
MTSELISLLLVLAPIALVDSTSITPLCIVPLIMLLSKEHPVLRASAFLFGIFAAYLVAGLLALFGLQQVFEQLNAAVSAQLKNPNSLFLLAQIVIGACMLVFGSRMANARESKEDRRPTESVSASQAFIGGAMLTIVGLPGALPLFAAIDQILRADPPLRDKVVAMAFYNVLFILPLCSAVLLRVVLGERSVPMLNRMNDIVTRAGRRVLIVALIIAGAVLVLDGIGWFLGHPLLPVW